MDPGKGNRDSETCRGMHKGGTSTGAGPTIIVRGTELLQPKSLVVGRVSSCQGRQGEGKSKLLPGLEQREHPKGVRVKFPGDLRGKQGLPYLQGWVR